MFGGRRTAKDYAFDPHNMTHVYYTLSFLPGAFEIAFQTRKPGSF